MQRPLRARQVALPGGVAQCLGGLRVKGVLDQAQASALVERRRRRPSELGGRTGSLEQTRRARDGGKGRGRFGGGGGEGAFLCGRLEE